MALGLGLLATTWIAHREYQSLLQRRSDAISGIVGRGDAALRTSLHDGELLLRSVQTLFLASQDVSQEEFANIYANLQAHERLPSLQAMVFAQRQVRADGEHFVTALVIPIAGNERVIGLDVVSQPGNLAGLLRSRDSDEPVMSAPFRLAQQRPGELPDGVTLRLPVYSTGAPPRTVEERRRRMRGSIAISLRLNRMISAALRETAKQGLHVQILDVTDGRALPVYDSRPADAKAGRGPWFERMHEYGGRRWQLRMYAAERLATVRWPWTIFAGGVLSSLLLALLVWSAATTRQRALQLGKRMSRSFRDSEARFRALNELLPAMVLLADRGHGRILYANQAARDRLGAGIESVELADVFEDPAVRARYQAGASLACSNAEAALRSTNGDHFWARLSISEVSLDGTPELLMVAADISEQRQLTELLTYQASHDALTELFNRREFERQVEQALARVAAGGPPSALLYIDLDQFKVINDTSGHVAGDQLLSQLSLVMREQMRAGEVLARLGGDEFGVLAANAERQGIMLLAERLRTHIDGYVFVWEQRTYTISASIGVVMIDDPSSTLKDLFAQADTACYMAKESGRNRIHLFLKEDDETTRRHGEMEWVNRLRWALDEGRLLLYYQQLEPLKGDGRGQHIELLLRLRDEDGAVVMPGAFLPAAERYGLMPLIDRWVIENALANFNRLHVDGPLLQSCAINLSGASIDDESLAERILELLRMYDVAPHRVCFEITETLAVRDMAQTVRFIERLRQVGCRIALDDFGAGMSSFGYLKNLPIDAIKIDGSFIRDMATDSMSLAIVRAVADIGHQRGLEVIAEWVADSATVVLLRGIGVDYAQGFALHVPEPVVFQRSG